MPSPSPARPPEPIPGADRLPLQGLTLLLVEDSRFAAEAVRLLCLRSGARLRRAATLAAAERHLATYKPDLAIVDLGLPDGDGTALVRMIARYGRFPALATSGDAAMRSQALSAGAQGFLEKPPHSLAAFQIAVLRCLPDHDQMPGPITLAGRPDPIALRDDLHLAAAQLRQPNAATQTYVLRFLSSLAQSAGDPALATAVGAARSDPDAMTGLRALLAARLAASPSAFASPQR